MEEKTGQEEITEETEIEQPEQEEAADKVEYEKCWCKYSFTEQEMRDIAERLAHKTQELADVEDQKKAVMAEFKERIERISTEIKSSSQKYRAGYEMRDIECEVDRDFKTGEVRYIRTDTGEIAKTKKMSMADRQRHIDDVLKDQKKAGEVEGCADDEMTDEEIRQQQETQRNMTSETSAL